MSTQSQSLYKEFLNEPITDGHSNISYLEWATNIVYTLREELKAVITDNEIIINRINRLNTALIDRQTEDAKTIAKLEDVVDRLSTKGGFEESGV